MKKQTAVEWLVNELVKKGFPIEKYGIDLYEQALAIEKEQIIDAYEQGEAEWTPFEFKTAQDYYTSTYE